MSRSHSFLPARSLSGIVILSAVLTLMGGCASVPAELGVSGPVVGRVHARGSQIYSCEQEAGKPIWKFKAPEATFEGDFSGKHYQGPTWEAADGSKVKATAIAKSTVSPDSVPWLLLQTTSNEGKGRLAEVTFVQRLNTTGGNPPVAEGAKAGDTARVEYTADYVFFGPGAKRTALPK